MKYPLLLVLLALAGLSGCVSNYKANEASIQSVITAGYSTIQFTRLSNSGLTGNDFTTFTVSKIDGPPHKLDFPIVLADTWLPIESGVNTLSVKIDDLRAIFSGNIQRMASGELQFIAAPRTAYILNGIINGDLATIWVSERDTMRRVTPETSFALSEEKKTEYPLVIPIPIPVK